MQTSEMPTSIHGGISVDAVGEALLKHYNVGIKNPWFEIGLSDQETYNRRKLPWAGKSYTIDESGEISGDADGAPDGLVTQWEAFAEESRATIARPGEPGEKYGDLETFYEEGLQNMDPPSTS